MLERFDEAELKYLEIHDLPPLKRWSQGRLTLLGDAAHATAPTLGQGGCQAMEDAILLARCLGSTTLGVPDGLARYEVKRRSRAELIVARSREKVEAMHASENSTPPPSGFAAETGCAPGGRAPNEPGSGFA